MSRPLAGGCGFRSRIACPLYTIAWGAGGAEHHPSEARVPWLPNAGARFSPRLPARYFARAAHHVAQVDADADAHLPFGGLRLVALRQRPLDFHRTPHRRQRAGEFDEETVAGRLDFRPLMFGKQAAQDAPMWRGWCVRITPDGKMIPTVAGIRSPGGIGMIPDGEMFCTDNQGVWNGSDSLKHLRVGSFQGHPETLKWWDETHGALGEKPLESADGTRIENERKRNPKYIPPAVVLPHGHVGNSPTSWDWDETGKFGPFLKQLFIADRSFSVLNRVTLEKVNGVYQGACYPFLRGFRSGPIAPLTQGHVHELSLPGLKSRNGTELLHKDAYYTLNEIPKP